MKRSVDMRHYVKGIHSFFRSCPMAAVAFDGYLKQIRGSAGRS